MEGFSTGRKRSGIERGIRGALAGVGFLTAGAIGVPQDATAASMKSVEAEASLLDQEAASLLDEVESMHSGIDDTRGKRGLRTRIEEKFSTYALAFAYRTSRSDVRGPLDPKITDAARMYLLPRLMQRGVVDSPGLQILQELMTGQQAPTPEHSSVSETSKGAGIGSQPSEIRHIRTKDW
jgi:hypothetical protein